MALPVLGLGASLLGGLFGGKESATRSSGLTGGDNITLNNLQELRNTEANRLGGVGQSLASRLDKSLRATEAGQLDQSAQSLQSRFADQARKLAGARQSSIASQFGNSPKLAKLLGQQDALRTDLAVNSSGFDAFRDQLGRQGQQQAGLQGLLGLQSVGFDALGSAQGSAQNLASSRASGTTSQDRGNIFDRLGNVGSLVGGRTGGGGLSKLFQG